MYSEIFNSEIFNSEASCKLTDFTINLTGAELKKYFKQSIFYVFKLEDKKYNIFLDIESAIRHLFINYKKKQHLNCVYKTDISDNANIIIRNNEINCTNIIFDDIFDDIFDNIVALAIDFTNQTRRSDMIEYYYYSEYQHKPATIKKINIEPDIEPDKTCNSKWKIFLNIIVNNIPDKIKYVIIDKLEFFFNTCDADQHLNNPNTFKYLPEKIKTKKLCEHYYNLDNSNFKYIPIKFISIDLVKKHIDINPCDYIYVPNQIKYNHPELSEKIIDKNASLYKHIPSKHKTLELTKKALSKFPLNYKYIPIEFKTDNNALYAFSLDAANYNHIPMHLKTIELTKNAIIRDPKNYKYIPPKYKTYDITEYSVMRCIDNYKYMPKEYTSISPCWMLNLMVIIKYLKIPQSMPYHLIPIEAKRILTTLYPNKYIKLFESNNFTIPEMAKDIENIKLNTKPNKFDLCNEYFINDDIKNLSEEDHIIEYIKNCKNSYSRLDENKKTNKINIAAITYFPSYNYEYVPLTMRTKEITMIAFELSDDMSIYNHVPEHIKSIDLLKTLVSSYPSVYKYLNYDEKIEEITIEAIKSNPTNVIFVPYEKMNKNIAKIAIKNNNKCLKYILPEFLF
jgi:hypothetical protein